MVSCLVCLCMDQFFLLPWTYGKLVNPSILAYEAHYATFSLQDYL